MTPIELIDKIEKAWPRKEKEKLDPDTAQLLAKKMSRFTDRQLDLIFDWILENCKMSPKLANVFEAAKELGFLSTMPTQARDTSVWTKTDCAMCRGEGAITVMMQRAVEAIFELDEDGNRQHVANKRTLKFRSLWPLSSDEKFFFKWEEGDVSYAFRCSCEASVNQPSGWPKWDSNRYERGSQAQVTARKEPEVIVEPEGIPMDRGLRLVPNMGDREKKTVPIQTVLSRFMEEWDESLPDA